MNIKQPIHPDEILRIVRDQSRLSRLLLNGARVPSIQPQGVHDSIRTLLKRIEELEEQLTAAVKEVTTCKAIAEEGYKAGLAQAAILFMDKVEADCDTADTVLAPLTHTVSNGEGGDYSAHWLRDAVFAFFEADKDGALAKLVDDRDGLFWDLKGQELEVKQLQVWLTAATKRAEDAERERDAALAVLRDLEFSFLMGTCVLCSRDRGSGHAPDCALAACLKGAE